MKAKTITINKNRFAIRSLTSSKGSKSIFAEDITSKKRSKADQEDRFAGTFDSVTDMKRHFKWFYKKTGPAGFLTKKR